jgi:pyruvate dehydrogenase E1 component alpha subunit
MFGFVHIYYGQGSISTGIIKSLMSNDYVCSTYRDHVHALSKDVPAHEIMAELFGKETGCSRDRGGSIHFFSSKYKLQGGFAIIGEGIPIATGTAFQSIYKIKYFNTNTGDITVTACFFGDETTNNG